MHSQAGREEQVRWDQGTIIAVGRQSFKKLLLVACIFPSTQTFRMQEFKEEPFQLIPWVLPTGPAKQPIPQGRGWTAASGRGHGPAGAHLVHLGAP